MKYLVEVPAVGVKIVTENYHMEVTKCLLLLNRLSLKINYIESMPTNEFFMRILHDRACAYTNHGYMIAVERWVL